VCEERQEVAFHALKQNLLSQPNLQYPDFSVKFTLTTDASNGGTGAVLSHGKIGEDLPITYAIRSFDKVEKNYSAFEK
jgi:hypothetical protein